MAATFDPLLPTLRDHLRLLIGDAITESGAAGNVVNPLLQDETIDAYLSTNSYGRAVYLCVQGLLSLTGQKVTSYSESGGISVNWGSRVAVWTDLRDQALKGQIRSPLTGSSGPQIAPMRFRTGMMRTD